MTFPAHDASARPAHASAREAVAGFGRRGCFLIWKVHGLDLESARATASAFGSALGRVTTSIVSRGNATSGERSIIAQTLRRSY